MSSSNTDIRFWHPENLVNEEKNILVIYFYANNPSDPLPRNQITFKHLAAIKKAKIVNENPENYDIKILPQYFEEKASYLIDLIQNVNYYDHEYSRVSFGMKVDGHKKRVEYVMGGLKEKYGTMITEFDMNEGYKLGRFLETLKGGIVLEMQYLERLKAQFQILPDKIKQEFGLQ